MSLRFLNGADETLQTGHHVLVEDEQQYFPHDLAGVVVGSHVLVGLTYVTAEGQVDRQEQLHGFVSRVDAQGVTIQVWGTEREFNLPPDFRGWELAAPGEYRLRSTGEVVVDPDFTTTWTIFMAKTGSRRRRWASWLASRLRKRSPDG